jgi:hypothetical protein
VRHFRCANVLCARKTFAEPLPNLLLPHAQRTSRLRESLRALGEVVGGEAAAQVSKRLGMTCSADTVLRLVRHTALLASLPVEVLGVDEWAWRKGQSYGTMLVDLERHAPVDVLEDASADSFAAWLKQHPNVRLITRDRAGTYADGACAGYLAYPFQNQEINSPAGNLNDTYLERRLQRKTLVELSLALFIWNGNAK